MGSMQTLGQMVEICLRARATAAMALLQMKQTDRDTAGNIAWAALEEIEQILEKVNNS